MAPSAKGPFVEPVAGVWNGELVTQVLQDQDVDQDGTQGGTQTAADAGGGGGAGGGAGGGGGDGGGGGGASDSTFVKVATTSGEQGYIRASYLVPVSLSAPEVVFVEGVEGGLDQATVMDGLGVNEEEARSWMVWLQEDPSRMAWFNEAMEVRRVASRRGTSRDHVATSRRVTSRRVASRPTQAPAPLYYYAPPPAGAAARSGTAPASGGEARDGGD